MFCRIGAGGSFVATVEGTKCAALYGNKGSVDAEDYGLYDMAGNVAEWVNDWYDAYPKKKSDNYTGPTKGTYRVIRGGGWSDKVSVLDPKEREKLNPVQSKETSGFRVVYSTGF